MSHQFSVEGVTAFHPELHQPDQHVVLKLVRIDVVKHVKWNVELVWAIIDMLIWIIVGQVSLHVYLLGVERCMIQCLSIQSWIQKHHIVQEGALVHILLAKSLKAVVSCLASLVAAGVPVVVVGLNEEPGSVGRVELINMGGILSVS